MANTNKVTFGKQESISGFSDDCRTQAIYLNGELVGEITIDVSNYGSIGYRDLKVDGYNVMLFGLGHEPYFTVERNNPGCAASKSARSVGAAAKRFVRETLLPMHTATDIYTERGDKQYTRPIAPAGSLDLNSSHRFDRSRMQSTSNV